LSEIRVTTISDTAGTGPVTLTKQSAAKVWAHYDNNGTFATKDSFNTSSLTDTAAGRCTINFSSNMSDGNYASPTSGGNAGATGTIYNLNPQSQSSSNTELRGRAHGGSSTTGLADLDFNFVAIHGDLA
jgi:hypothetical protein